MFFNVQNVFGMVKSQELTLVQRVKIHHVGVVFVVLERCDLALLTLSENR
jgi:hypothetical protein